MIWLTTRVESFAISRLSPQRVRVVESSTPNTLPLLLLARYGPAEEPHSPMMDTKNNHFDDNNSDNSNQNAVSPQQKEAFQQLLYQVMTVKDPQHIPGLLTNHITLLVDSLSGKAGADMIQEILQDIAKQQEQQQQQGPTVEYVSQILDLMVTFTEDFVQQAAQLDQQNKELLGRILKVMAATENNKKTAAQREDELDRLLQTSHLSAGFLRHLQGECERIMNAPKTTPQSARLLETLRVIQTRVLEELGQAHLGEAAVVLGQLIGYDSVAERMAVLDAGLMVRGVEFAMEMKDLTVQALDGFTRVPGGADPGLVQCIQEIDERLLSYLEENQAGFQ